MPGAPRPEPHRGYHSAETKASGEPVNKCLQAFVVTTVTPDGLDYIRKGLYSSWMTSVAPLGMERLLANLRAAAEPTRLRILALCALGELSVSELTEILSQSQPRVSRHLRLLCDAGLIERHREGNWVFHRIGESGPDAAIARALVALVPADDPDHQRDLERLHAARRQRADAAEAYFRRNAGQWDEIRSLHVDEKEVERRLLALLPRRRLGTLLDVGTGTGRIVELMAPKVGRAIGIDQSREMLAVARDKFSRGRRANVALRQADMYRLPVEDSSVDVVTIHQVLHFADDPAAAVGEAARVLQPGGRLILVDFAPHELEHLRAEHAHRRLGFSDEEVSEWCRARGLVPAPPIHLAGSPLTVALWTADKPGDVAHAAGSAGLQVAAAGGASFF